MLTSTCRMNMFFSSSIILGKDIDLVVKYFPTLRWISPTRFNGLCWEIIVASVLIFSFLYFFFTPLIILLYILFPHCICLLIFLTSICHVLTLTTTAIRSLYHYTRSQISLLSISPLLPLCPHYS